jgi:DNA polymerase-3 subunit delta'
MSKWRLIGQDNVVAFLAGSLEKGGLAHAYLFSAPEHSGKTALALKLAQALNCTGDSPPCGGCEPCRRIAAGIHADVQVIGVATSEEGKSKVELSIEQVRAINHAASLPPFEGRCRVFILEEAERMSIGAANALLKTLEEPPPKVVFVLTTARENLLPETVRSRCLKLRLSAAPRREISRFLEEELGFTAERAGLLARLSQGRAGWAIVAAGDEAVLSERRENLDRFVEALESGYDMRFDLAAKLAQRFGKTRAEVYRLLEQWLSFCRDVLLVKLDIKDEVVNTDYEASLEALSARLGTADVRSLIGSLVGARQHLEQNASARLALEVLMLGLPLLGGSLKANG